MAPPLPPSLAVPRPPSPPPARGDGAAPGALMAATTVAWMLYRPLLGGEGWVWEKA
jgi:hypothetical protein